jgi:hypothetical protein
MKAKLLAKKQQGAATLFTALVLLISITLVSVLTSKTVLVETQNTADNYRTSQAAAAASAAMDQAVAYFKAGGLDQIADGLVDYTGPGNEPTTASCAMPATTAFPLTLISGAQTTYAQFYFDNTDDNACDCQATATEDQDSDTDGDCMGILGTNMTRALVTAKGWSDDCSAVRTITQCVGTYDIFDSGQSPQQPFVSKGGIGVFGNPTIINRYNNSSVWAGGADVVHGAAFGTYLRPSNTEQADYTTAELDSSCEGTPCNDADNPGPNTQLVSNRDAGNGIDIITDDQTLASKTSTAGNLTDPAQNTFFDMFFAHTKSEIRNSANDAGQMFPADTDPTGKTGLVWIDGNTSLGGNGEVGTPTNPVILIVNGDFNFSGSGNVYGVIYVIGSLQITGSPTIKGSIVSESGTTGGGGTFTLVFKPWGDDGTNAAPPFIAGTGAVIGGSWKDWN